MEEHENKSAEPLLVVAAALIDRDGRVLVQQRPPGKAHAGLWEFPGGKLEPRETPEAALVRELDEEPGIAVDPAALEPVAFATASLGDRSLILLLYACRRWAGAPQANEAAGLRLEVPLDLRALPMPPADISLVEALIRMA